MNELSNFLLEPKVKVQIELEEGTALKIVTIALVVIVMFFATKLIYQKLN